MPVLSSVVTIKNIFRHCQMFPVDKVTLGWGPLLYRVITIFQGCSLYPLWNKSLEQKIAANTSFIRCADVWETGEELSQNILQIYACYSHMEGIKLEWCINFYNFIIFMHYLTICYYFASLKPSYNGPSVLSIHMLPGIYVKGCWKK